MRNLDDPRAGGGSSGDELAFRWRGDRLSVDFTATVGERWNDGIERLRQPADLARWFVEAGLSVEPVGVDAATLLEAQQLREAVYRVLTAVRTGHSPRAADVSEVDRWSRRAAPGPGLRQDGRELRADASAADARDLLGMLARDAVDLVTGPLVRRIRECAHAECGLLFVDGSRAGARRWCDVQACGARARMADYRRRKSGS